MLKQIGGWNVIKPYPVLNNGEKGRHEMEKHRSKIEKGLLTWSCGPLSYEKDGLHGRAVGLHTKMVDLHGRAAGLHGRAVGLHTKMVGLHGRAVGLHTKMVGLHARVVLPPLQIV